MTDVYIDDNVNNVINTIVCIPAWDERALLWFIQTMFNIFRSGSL